MRLVTITVTFEVGESDSRNFSIGPMYGVGLIALSAAVRRLLNVQVLVKIDSRKERNMSKVLHIALVS